MLQLALEGGGVGPGGGDGGDGGGSVGGGSDGGGCVGAPAHVRPGGSHPPLQHVPPPSDTNGSEVEQASPTGGGGFGGPGGPGGAGGPTVEHQSVDLAPDVCDGIQLAVGIDAEARDVLRRVAELGRMADDLGARRLAGRRID